jgi:hypothetical protein
MVDTVYTAARCWWLLSSAKQILVSFGYESWKLFYCVCAQSYEHAQQQGRGCSPCFTQPLQVTAAEYNKVSTCLKHSGSRCLRATHAQLSI